MKLLDKDRKQPYYPRPNKKGCIPWNRGISIGSPSEKHRLNISNSKKGINNLERKVWIILKKKPIN